MEFTVDLDEMWREWGYSQKNKAVEYLTRNFVEGEDYCFTNGKAKGRGGHNRRVWLLKAEAALKMAKSIQTQAALDFKNEKLDKTAAVIEKLGQGVNSMSGSELAVIALTKLLDENKALEDKVRSLTPPATAYSELMAADGLLSMAEVAKALGWGPKLLFKELRRRHIFYDRLPYQNHVDCGRFEVKITEKNGRVFAVALVTAKGLDWLRKQLEEPCTQIIAHETEK